MGNYLNITQVVFIIFQDGVMVTSGADLSKKKIEKFYEGYKYVDNPDIEIIYEMQFPDGKAKNINDEEKRIKQMRKEIDKQFSQHRMYFNDDFEIEKQLREQENIKNRALLTGNQEMYNKAIDKQDTLQKEREDYIINILKTTRLVQPEDKNVREMIHNAVKPEPYLERNNRFNLPDTPKGNINKLEIKKGSNQNVNETLKKLRERVGN